MIQTSLLTALLATACLVSGADASPRGRGHGGLSLAFNRHGDHELSVEWTSRGYGNRYGRPASVIRPRYDLPSAGHYEWRTERVWVPAAREKVFVEPVVRVHYDACGRRIETVVRTGHYEIVYTPGHYEERQVRVFVAAPTAICRF